MYVSDAIRENHIIRETTMTKTGDESLPVLDRLYSHATILTLH